MSFNAGKSWDMEAETLEAKSHKPFHTDEGEATNGTVVISLELYALSNTEMYS